MRSQDATLAAIIQSIQISTMQRGTVVTVVVSTNCSSAARSIQNSEFSSSKQLPTVSARWKLGLGLPNELSCKNGGSPTSWKLAIGGQISHSFSNPGHEPTDAGWFSLEAKLNYRQKPAAKLNIPTLPLFAARWSIFMGGHWHTYNDILFWSWFRLWSKIILTQNQRVAENGLLTALTAFFWRPWHAHRMRSLQDCLSAWSWQSVAHEAEKDRRENAGSHPVAWYNELRVLLLRPQC